MSRLSIKTTYEGTPVGIAKKPNELGFLGTPKGN